MFRSLFAIMANTFTEILRQPVFAVVLGAAIFLIVLTPSLSMFSMDDDNMLLSDVCLSTLLVAGLFLAVFAASSVVSREIENKTVLTVVTKSVGRNIFVFGKFLGVALALILAQYILSIVVMMVVRHGVMQRASDESDLVVIILGSITTVLILLIGGAGNFFYNWRFSSTAVYSTTFCLTLLMGFLLVVDPHWKFNPAENHMKLVLVGPILLAILASLIIAAFAVVTSLRMNLVATLILCSVFFVLGTIIQYWLGPIAAQGGIHGWFAWAGLTIIPSLNMYNVTNAVYDGRAVELNYLSHAALYAFCYIVAILALGMAIFRNRQIG